MRSSDKTIKHLVENVMAVDNMHFCMLNSLFLDDFEAYFRSLLHMSLYFNEIFVFIISSCSWVEFALIFC